MGEHPRSVEDIVRNFQMRREGLLKALTTGAPRPAPPRAPGPPARGTMGRKTLADDGDSPSRGVHLDIDVFFQECDPERENLCLYGARPAARPPAAPRISRANPQGGGGGRADSLETNAGEPDGSWKVDLPEEEVPPELPEPVLGINFARDGMQRCVRGPGSADKEGGVAPDRFPATQPAPRPPGEQEGLGGLDRRALRRVAHGRRLLLRRQA